MEFVTNSELIRHLKNYHDMSNIATVDNYGNVRMITGVSERRINGVYTTVIVLGDVKYDYENES